MRNFIHLSTITMTALLAVACGGKKGSSSAPASAGCSAAGCEKTNYTLSLSKADQGVAAFSATEGEAVSWKVTLTQDDPKKSRYFVVHAAELPAGLSAESTHAPDNKTPMVAITGTPAGNGIIKLKVRDITMCEALTPASGPDCTAADSWKEELQGDTTETIAITVGSDNGDDDSDAGDQSGADQEGNNLKGCADAATNNGLTFGEDLTNTIQDSLNNGDDTTTEEGADADSGSTGNRSLDVIGTIADEITQVVTDTTDKCAGVKVADDE